MERETFIFENEKGQKLILQVLILQALILQALALPALHQKLVPPPALALLALQGKNEEQ